MYLPQKTSPENRILLVIVLGVGAETVLMEAGEIELTGWDLWIKNKVRKPAKANDRIMKDDITHHFLFSRFFGGC